jgi:hypothetical protein
MKNLLWLLIAEIGLVIGCNKIDVVPKEHRSAHFEKVFKHLDLGGSVFMYMDIEGDVQSAAEFVNNLIKRIPQKDEDQRLANVDAVKISQQLGLNTILAGGLSSYRDGKIYRNKAFICNQGPREGLLLISGSAPHTLEAPYRAPQDADIVFENDLNLKAIYDVVMAVLHDVASNEADQIASKVDEKIPGVTLTYREIINQLNTRVVGVIRVDKDKTFSLPTVNIAVPYTELLLGLDNMGFLFDAVQEKLKSIPVIQIAEDGTMKLLELSISLPGTMSGYRPVLAKDSKTNRLWLSTSRTFLKEYFSEKAVLAQSPEFRQATKNFPVEANGISYMGPAMIAKLQKLLGSIATISPDINDVVEIMRALLPEPGIATATTYSNLPDGIFFASNTTTSHKSTFVALGYANISVIGLVAAVAIPNFIKHVRDTREESEMDFEEPDDLPQPGMPDEEDPQQQNKLRGL